MSDTGPQSSPSRIATLTEKIVSLMSSPLRYAADQLVDEKPMIVDEEITLRGRSTSAGGMVGTTVEMEGNDSFPTVRMESNGSFPTVRMGSNGSLSIVKTEGNGSFPTVRMGSNGSFSTDTSFYPATSTELYGQQQTISKESIPPMGRSFSNEETAKLREFDPVGLIAFDGISGSPTPTPTKGRTISTPSRTLLDIDTISPLSPASQPKYTERDMQLLRGQLEERAERQSELLQLEISTLQAKYTEALGAGEEMRGLLSEYERTMAQVVEIRQQNSDQMTSMEQLAQEKRQLMIDLQAMQIAFANLKQRYEENKTMNEQIRLHEQGLKANISALQTDLGNADRRYDALRKHAEDKLNEANEELHRLKTTLEIELSATRAKLHKTELKVSGLESTVDSKTKENGELMAICDELIQKIDSQAVAAGSSKSAAVLASLNINRSALPM